MGQSPKKIAFFQLSNRKMTIKKSRGMYPALFQNRSGGKSKGPGGEIYTFIIQPSDLKSKSFLT